MGKYQIHLKPAAVERVTLEFNADELVAIGSAIKARYRYIWADLEKYPNRNDSGPTATIYRALKAADMLSHLDDE